MFESAEIGHALDKESFERALPPLREALLEAQYELVRSKRFPAIIVIGGIDAAGKSETINLLNEWMDPRHIRTIGLGPATDEERARPPMWRFWRVLPPKGRIALFSGGWYTESLADEVYGRGKLAFDRWLDEVMRFEEMLVNEDALLIKFWLHLSKKKQKARLRALSKDRETRWRVTKQDWENHARYDVFRKLHERMICATSAPRAPWTIVEATDPRYRSLTVGTALLAALRSRLADSEPRVRGHEPPHFPQVDRRDVLNVVDLSRSLDDAAYDKALAHYQGRLNRLVRRGKFRNVAAVVVFEGNDAAGKGGAIRRITGALDARQYEVIPTAAPTEEEQAQPYLWRFWRHVPGKGKIALYDRSWYGRVLVERVEHLTPVEDWMRAYGEINDMEEQFVRHGIVVVKFWLAISKAEQLRRFRERERTSFKHYKIGDDDWRNRKKWDAYHEATRDMIDRTSSGAAPWVIVPAEDKKYARIEVLKTLCERIECALDD